MSSSRMSQSKVVNSHNTRTNLQKTSGTGSSTNKQSANFQKILHESIVDLYLQVKIRSNDEIDQFGQGQFGKERDRLLKFDSLTILDYIRTSIEILMQMKCEDDKGGSQGENQQKDRFANFGVDHNGVNRTDDNVNSEMVSTFRSLDLPPKEYEQQLQQYEAEVRNHIKVEQQLKLHIEVLQERIEELEKEREGFEEKLAKEKKEVEKKIKESCSKLLNQKQLQLDKVCRELKKSQQDFMNLNQMSMETQHNTSQVVRVNNFLGKEGGQNNQKIRLAASSHSPSDLNGGGNKKKIGKIIVGKSPYLNDCFNKNQQATAQSSNGANEVSQASSSKSNRKNANQSSEVSESSLIVLKKGKIKTSNGDEKPAKPINNMKLIAAIQKMRQQPSAQSKSTSSQNSQGMNIINHKKNKSSLITSGGAVASSSKNQSVKHHHANSDKVPLQIVHKQLKQQNNNNNNDDSGMDSNSFQDVGQHTIKQNVQVIGNTGSAIRGIKSSSKGDSATRGSNSVKHNKLVNGSIIKGASISSSNNQQNSSMIDASSIIVTGNGGNSNNLNSSMKKMVLKSSSSNKHKNQNSVVSSSINNNHNLQSTGGTQS